MAGLPASTLEQMRTPVLFRRALMMTASRCLAVEDELLCKQ
jgi:hypothetical protein